MYMGQYRFEAGMSLTGEKWGKQKEKVCIVLRALAVLH